MHENNAFLFPCMRFLTHLEMKYLRRVIELLNGWICLWLDKTKRNERLRAVLFCIKVESSSLIADSAVI